MTHLLFFFPVFLSRAARVANSKTSRTPSLVLAEHSRYLVALMLLATARPCDGVSQHAMLSCAVGSNPALCAYLLGGHGLLARLAELVEGPLLEAQILLAADENLGDVRAEVMYFGAPLSSREQR